MVQPPPRRSAKSVGYEETSSRPLGVLQREKKEKGIYRLRLFFKDFLGNIYLGFVNNTVKLFMERLY